MLNEKGISRTAAEKLLDGWLIRGDYLLADLPFHFSHIVGNPPYVRQELNPSALLAEYRHRFDKKKKGKADAPEHRGPHERGPAIRRSAGGREGAIRVIK